MLKNYQQVKISAPPNVNEPVSFDQLPDGRIIQTARPGTVRLHDPVKGTTTILADFSSAALPQTMRVYYNNTETGMYGGAVDNDFATNHWVYLYYAPQTVTNVKLSDGSIVTQTTPNTTPPNNSPTLAALGSVHRLQPAEPLQAGRRRRQPAVPGPHLRAADPARPGQPPALLPRRR